MGRRWKTRGSQHLQRQGAAGHARKKAPPMTIMPASKAWLAHEYFHKLGPATASPAADWFQLSLKEGPDRLFATRVFSGDERKPRRASASQDVRSLRARPVRGRCGAAGPSGCQPQKLYRDQQFLHPRPIYDKGGASDRHAQDPGLGDAGYRKADRCLYFRPP